MRETLRLLKDQKRKRLEWKKKKHQGELSEGSAKPHGGITQEDLDVYESCDLSPPFS